MENKDHIQEVEEMKTQAKFEFIDADEEKDSEKKKLLEQFNNELTNLFDDFKEWVKYQNQPEKIEARKQKLKEESEKLVSRTKTLLDDVKNNETLNKTMSNVGNEAKKYYDALAHGVSQGVEAIKDNEYVQKTVETISEGMHQFSEDERVKQTSSKLKKGTLNAATGAYNSLKKVLEEKTDVNEIDNNTTEDHQEQ
ncbi:MAG: hypothetical protein RR863_03880 [Erysipelotrichaceae bacterium]